MNDPANFGMAKSFFMGGQSAGFDMTNEAEANQFIMQYNANLLTQEPDLASSLAADELLRVIPGSSSFSRGKKTQTAKKKRRKIAKATRRKNRKKRK